jgi:hypothetical protein
MYEAAIGIMGNGGHSMRLYLIAIILAFVGLWISSEVHADGLCGLRTSHVFSVESWEAENAADDEIDYVISLKSRDDKAIKSVGGTVEFFLGGHSAASLQIAFDQPLKAQAVTTLYLGAPSTKSSARLVGAGKGKVTALACIDHIDYVDGSGTIIN